METKDLILESFLGLTMPLARVLGLETSVTMAVHRLTLPLLIPPTIRATTKIRKLLDTAQMAYEAATPTCH